MNTYTKYQIWKTIYIRDRNSYLDGQLVAVRGRHLNGQLVAVSGRHLNENCFEGFDSPVAYFSPVVVAFRDYEPSRTL